ncbi:hypothetical protein D3C80_1136880 [compost metagenome]
MAANHSSTEASDSSLKNQLAKGLRSTMISTASSSETSTDNVPAVFHTLRCSSGCSANSAVYLVTPVLTAPLARVVNMVTAFCSWPMAAYPAGPTYRASTLLRPSKVAIFTATAMALSRLVLIRVIPGTQGREKLLQASMTCWTEDAVKVGSMGRLNTCSCSRSVSGNDRSASCG